MKGSIIEEKKTGRMVGLDLFRIAMAFTVFAFHSEIHVGCQWGVLTPFFSMGAVMMTGFFVLSGYVLWIGYDKQKYRGGNTFLLKRMISILPSYYMLALLHGIFLDRANWLRNLILLPTEALCLQSVFYSLFSFSHNSGTWFVSCIFLCYLLFPYLQNLIQNMSKKSRGILWLVCVGFLLYQPCLVGYLDIANNYSNPFFRMIEFMTGILTAALTTDTWKGRTARFLSSYPVLLTEALFMMVGISLAVKLNFYVGNYMLYSWITLPVLVLLIPGLAKAEFRWIQSSHFMSVVLSYLSAVSYDFFLAQYFVWPIMRKTGFANSTNWIRCLVAFSLCMLLTVSFYEAFEKPVRKRLKAKFRLA